MKSVDYAIHVSYIEDMKFKLRTKIRELKKFVILVSDKFSVPVVTIIFGINEKTLIPLSLENTLNGYLVYFLDTSNFVGLNSFGKKNLVHVSIFRTTREYGFHM